MSRVGIVYEVSTPGAAGAASLNATGALPNISVGGELSNGSGSRESMFRSPTTGDGAVGGVTVTGWMLGTVARMGRGEEGGVANTGVIAGGASPAVTTPSCDM